MPPPGIIGPPGIIEPPAGGRFDISLMPVPGIGSPRRAVVPPAGGGAATVEYLDFQPDPSNSPYSETCQFGTATADRLLVAYFLISGGTAANTVTIGGVTATLVDDGTTEARNNASNNGVELWQAKVTTGTSGTVAWDVTGGGSRSCVALWAIKGHGSDTPDNVELSSINVDPLTITSDILAGGVGIAAAQARDGSDGDPYSWTGLTKDFEEQVEVHDPTGASKAYATLQSGLEVKVDDGGTNTSRMVFATWS